MVTLPKRVPGQTRLRSDVLAGAERIELPLAGSKPAVLPLDDTPICSVESRTPTQARMKGRCRLGSLHHEVEQNAGRFL